MLGRICSALELSEDLCLAEHDAVEAARDPELAELLASYRAELVVVVDAILAQRGKEHSTERAEAVVAAYDGVLASALLKPRAPRQEFVSRSLELIFAALAPE